MTRDSTSSGNAPQTGVAPFNATSVAASLTVKDIQRSLAWYRDVVGFTVDREHQRDGQLRAVSFRAGAVRLLITQDDGAKGLDRAKGEGFSLQYTVAGSVDDVADRIKRCGGTLDSEPADMPWGVRVFRLRDPDGFKLVISS
ncbi:MAG TPA: VOC family protein [Gemmatimonadaceae bacterium]|jgi:uncharacterized glyoxalase superfamily protein PhnB|nr:VOC family protein [Gemmatimonadaceae bacterium]